VCIVIAEFQYRLYRELRGNIYACGERSAGLGENLSETALVEAGTEHDLGWS
jgi:hypothetical protein